MDIDSAVSQNDSPMDDVDRETLISDSLLALFPCKFVTSLLEEAKDRERFLTSFTSLLSFPILNSLQKFPTLASVEQAIQLNDGLNAEYYGEQVLSCTNSIMKETFNIIDCLLSPKENKLFSMFVEKSFPLVIASFEEESKDDIVNFLRVIKEEKLPSGHTDSIKALRCYFFEKYLSVLTNFTLFLYSIQLGSQISISSKDSGEVVNDTLSNIKYNPKDIQQCIFCKETSVGVGCTKLFLKFKNGIQKDLLAKSSNEDYFCLEQNSSLQWSNVEDNFHMFCFFDGTSESSSAKVFCHSCLFRFYLVNYFGEFPKQKELEVTELHDPSIEYVSQMVYPLCNQIESLKKRIMDNKSVSIDCTVDYVFQNASAINFPSFENAGRQFGSPGDNFTIESERLFCFRISSDMLELASTSFITTKDTNHIVSFGFRKCLPLWNTIRYINMPSVIDSNGTLSNKISTNLTDFFSSIFDESNVAYSESILCSPWKFSLSNFFGFTKCEEEELKQQLFTVKHCIPYKASLKLMKLIDSISIEISVSRNLSQIANFPVYVPNQEAFVTTTTNVTTTATTTTTTYTTTSQVEQMFIPQQAITPTKIRTLLDIFLGSFKNMLSSLFSIGHPVLIFQILLSIIDEKYTQSIDSKCKFCRIPGHDSKNCFFVSEIPNANFNRSNVNNTVMEEQKEEREFLKNNSHKLEKLILSIANDFFNEFAYFFDDDAPEQSYQSFDYQLSLRHAFSPIFRSVELARSSRLNGHGLVPRFLCPLTILTSINNNFGEMLVQESDINKSSQTSTFRLIPYFTESSYNAQQELLSFLRNNIHSYPQKPASDFLQKTMGALVTNRKELIEAVSAFVFSSQNFTTETFCYHTQNVPVFVDRRIPVRIAKDILDSSMLSLIYHNDFQSLLSSPIEGAFKNNINKDIFHPTMVRDYAPRLETTLTFCNFFSAFDFSIDSDLVCSINSTTSLDSPYWIRNRNAPFQLEDSVFMDQSLSTSDIRYRHDIDLELPKNTHLITKKFLSVLRNARFDENTSLKINKNRFWSFFDKEFKVLIANKTAESASERAKSRLNLWESSTNATLSNQSIQFFCYSNTLVEDTLRMVPYFTHTVACSQYEFYAYVKNFACCWDFFIHLLNTILNSFTQPNSQNSTLVKDVHNILKYKIPLQPPDNESEQQKELLATMEKNSSFIVFLFFRQLSIFVISLNNKDNSSGNTDKPKTKAYNNKLDNFKSLFRTRAFAFAVSIISYWNEYYKIQKEFIFAARIPKEEEDLSTNIPESSTAQIPQQPNADAEPKKRGRKRNSPENAPEKSTTSKKQKTASNKKLEKTIADQTKFMVDTNNEVGTVPQRSNTYTPEYLNNPSIANLLSKSNSTAKLTTVTNSNNYTPIQTNRFSNFQTGIVANINTSRISSEPPAVTYIQSKTDTTKVKTESPPKSPNPLNSMTPPNIQQSTGSVVNQTSVLTALRGKKP